MPAAAAPATPAAVAPAFASAADRALRQRILRILAPGALALALCACAVQRELVISSQPEGAEVRLDGESVGRTPLRIPFEHYGTRRFTFYLDGYVTDSQVVEISPPWYGIFPLDIVSEVLVPLGWRDRHRIHADLQPGTGAIAAPDLESVFARAAALRNAGPEGPLPVVPPQPDTPPPPRRPTP